jgi:uncharacterized damage-inducible protein DinB
MSIAEIHDKSSMKAALRQSFGDVIYACDKLKEEQFYAPWAEGKWTPGDIIGHLILSTKTVNNAFKTPKIILKTTFGKVKRSPYSYDEIKSSYHAVLLGFQAPSNFVYNGVKEKGKSGMIQSFNIELENMNRHIDKWKEEDLLAYQLPHPVLGKLSLKEMIFFTIIHTDHHRKQIEAVMV